MSNQYWRALNDEKADDSEYLKEYQSLSEKLMTILMIGSSIQIFL